MRQVENCILHKNLVIDPKKFLPNGTENINKQTKQGKS